MLQCSLVAVKYVNNNILQIVCQMFHVIAILGLRVFVGFSKANSKEKIIILKYR